MPRSRKKNKIWVMSCKQLSEFQANMRVAGNKENHKVNLGSQPNNQFPSKNINIGRPIAKPMSNSVAKGASKATASSVEKCWSAVVKQKALLRSRVDGKDTLKETHALTRKGAVNDASQPTNLKAMSWLVPKTADRLGQYSDPSSRLKKRATSDNEEHITSAEYSTTKLELSKDIDMVPKDSCTAEGKKRQKENVVDKEKVIEFGEYQKEADTLNTLLDRGLVEKNMAQFANCNGKNNKSMSKKRKEPFFEENPKALDDDSNGGVQVDNMSCKNMKKLKQSVVTRKDEAEHGRGDLNHVGVEDDSTSILRNNHAKVTVASCVEQQCYSCSKPIDNATWSGIFKTNDKKYVSLDGHLSTKSCEKAWNLSRQLLKVVEVKKLLRLEVWPKAWEVSTPTGDDIGIYFFPHEMRQDEGLDELVREVMENDLALQAIIGEAEVLIFPSILLPNHHQTFQRKHYLWGVFRRRQNTGPMVEEILNAKEHCEKEKQQNLILGKPSHMLPGEETNQEMIQIGSVIPLERHTLPPNKSTQDIEVSHLKGPTQNGFDLNKAHSEEGGQTEAAPIATNAVAFLASQGQFNPSMGHSPGRLMGFVVQKTPKLDRIIREIEQEGALVFAMQGEMVGAGSWIDNKTTATQK